MRRSLTRTMLMDLPPHLPRRVCGAVRRSDRKIPGSAWLRVALRWSRFATVPPRPPCAGGCRRRRCGCGWWWIELRKFRHFPGQFVQLIYQFSILRQGECNFRIWFAQQTFEPVQVGGGRRRRFSLDLWPVLFNAQCVDAVLRCEEK